MKRKIAIALLAAATLAGISGAIAATTGTPAVAAAPQSWYHG